MINCYIYKIGQSINIIKLIYYYYYMNLHTIMLWIDKIDWIDLFLSVYRINKKNYFL